jgi:hypothetical protein
MQYDFAGKYDKCKVHVNSILGLQQRMCEVHLIDDIRDSYRTILKQDEENSQTKEEIEETPLSEGGIGLVSGDENITDAVFNMIMRGKFEFAALDSIIEEKFGYNKLESLWQSGND